MAAYVLREECRECGEWWQVGLPAVNDGVDGVMEGGLAVMPCTV